MAVLIALSGCDLTPVADEIDARESDPPCPPVAPTTLADYYPLEVGHRWVYDYESRSSSHPFFSNSIAGTLRVEVTGRLCTDGTARYVIEQRMRGVRIDFTAEDTTDVVWSGTTTVLEDQNNSIRYQWLGQAFHGMERVEFNRYDEPTAADTLLVYRHHSTVHGFTTSHNLRLVRGQGVNYQFRGESDRGRYSSSASVTLLEVHLAGEN